jgi:predicted alpha/beta hydrolase
MTVEAAHQTIAARDGYHLAATVFGSKKAADRVVIVACATGVRRGFYEPYARYLAANGCVVVTFDYRGIGGSLRGPVAASGATIREWGELDQAAVVDHAAGAFPDKPIQIVGHSVGGQLVGLLDNVERVTAVCTVAAQHGYWRLYPFAQAITYGMLWYVGMPLLARVLKYFPARRLRLGEDLPRGVALEWSRFARSPHYFVGPDGAPLRAGFDAYSGAVLAYSFSDDPRAPTRCVRALHAYFRRAQVEHREITPASIAARAIGHIGFFRSSFKQSLWKDSLDWLRAHSSRARPGAQGTTVTG